MKTFLTFLTLLLLSCTAQLAGAATPTDWQPYGNAEFTDGWILPYFEITQPSDRTWKIEVEKSASQNIFRLISPYHQPGFTDKFPTRPNTTSPVDIIIDCTDPDFVRIPYQHIFTFTDGIFSSGNQQDIWAHTRADYYESQGRTPEAITNAGLNNTSEGNTITLRECLIGFTSDPFDGAHTWNPGAFDTVITLLPSSSIEPTEITPSLSDAHSTPSEFYNLQGTRIQTPVPGQICIKRTAEGSFVKHRY